MKSKTKALVIGGFLFFSLMLSMSCLMVGDVMAQVSFTYTAPVTEKTVETGELTQFTSTLINTGSGDDIYDVDMIEKPPTPPVWWMRFCSGGICWDSTVTHATVSLVPSETDEILLDILPRTPGTSKVTLRITSQANPSLKDSVTFILNTSAQIPILNRWGLILFIILISGSGCYLLWRRLKLSEMT